jgi:hypothetical protein
MKPTLLLLFVISLLNFCARAQTITKYYDNEWSPTTQDKASFYADFVKEGSLYQGTSYYLQTGKIRGKSAYPDTILANPRGMLVLYGKNGNLEDSGLFDMSGKLVYSYHYHPNKKLAARYYVPDGKTEPIIEGFDEDGNKIKDYVYAKEAEFKGGEKKWGEYLSKNLSKDFSSKDDQQQTVHVRILFIVNETGQVIRPKVLESSGIKTIDADAIRVLISSPPWIPALQYNKPVKVYRIQPFTYVLYPPKKK